MTVQKRPGDPGEPGGLPAQSGPARVTCPALSTMVWWVSSIPSTGIDMGISRGHH